MRAGAEERVDDHVGALQHGGHRGGIFDEARDDPGAAQLLVLQRGVPSQRVGGRRQQDVGPRARALEPPRDDEAVAPVAAAATHDGDP